MDSFTVGDLYSSDQIQQSLNVGNAGGVRVSVGENGLVKRMVILTSFLDTKTVRENPYHDRVEDEILTYTGAGREGDQSLSGVNSRIAQQPASLFPIYGFTLIASRRDKSVGPKRWRFLGLLEYLRHYLDYQVDAQGEPRRVTINDQEISRITLLESEQISRLNEEDRTIVDSEQDEVAQNKTTVFGMKVIESMRAKLLNATPREFEFAVQRALSASGFERAQVTRYSQDGGIDVNAFASCGMWPIENLLIQVQAKRWLHSVGRKEVAELRGSLQPFARGAVVTTSHFSKAALREASESGKNPIVLLDGPRFAELMCRIGDSVK
jgi:hypothetical protein